MRTLILAGGMGTRLKGIINDIPKPMAPVGKKPFLEYLILQLKRHKLTDIVICLGFKGDKIKEYFKDGKRWGVKISYSIEYEPLGTGGAIKFAEKLINDENFIVMNGDSFLEIDLNMMINFHLDVGSYITIALVEVEDPARYGIVEINGRNKIKNFDEKSSSLKLKLVNAGVYIFNRKILHYFPNGKVSLEEEIFPKLIGKGIYGFPVKGFFIDIGTPESYKSIRNNSKILINLINKKKSI